MEIVAVKNLKKTYGDFTAVNDVSFCIEEGEVFGFLGPNGAGKTSTINMMIGLLRPTAGTIAIDGIDACTNIKKAQAVMGIVPDESNLYDDINGFDNLCFCGALYGMPKAEREEKANILLKQFHLEQAGKRPFKAYSKGMRRKLTIAAAIIHSPKIFFLDEPTTGIDVESARQIRELILDLKKQGTTVFITTHYIEDAQRICDRIAFIVGGKIVAADTVANLMENAAKGHTVQFLSSRPLEGLEEQLIENFPQSQVEVQGEQLVMRSEKQLALLPVMQFLAQQGAEVFEARELRPTLEDVFVKITGIEADNLKKEKEKAGGKK